ncbi:MAG: hypothetical protein AUH42_02370 [Gemmatimonadetes bacterium 13_1_40CM_70_11]|nr:MAG: hypothetical protein AUH42_02370 [Gemmatimonadetes bacterium 13_1_40CM_70_11]
MPIEMDRLQPERLAHAGELLREALHAPERRITRMVRAAGAELIVKDHRAFVGERRERFQVRARDAGAAVEHEERRPCTAADDAIPDSSSRDLHVAFARGEDSRTTACAG